MLSFHAMRSRWVLTTSRPDFAEESECIVATFVQFGEKRSSYRLKAQYFPAAYLDDLDDLDHLGS